MTKPFPRANRRFVLPTVTSASEAATRKRLARVLPPRDRDLTERIALFNIRTIENRAAQRATPEVDSMHARANAIDPLARREGRTRSRIRNDRAKSIGDRCGERHRVLHSTFDRVTRTKAVAVSSFQLCAKYLMPIGRHDREKRSEARTSSQKYFAQTNRFRFRLKGDTSLPVFS